MSANKLHRLSYTIGIFCFLILISIGYITTTNEVRSVVMFSRYVAVGGVLLALLIGFFIRKITVAQLQSITLYVLLMIWGYGLAFAYGSTTLSLSAIGMNLLVTTSGLMLVGARPSAEILYDNIAFRYVFYVAIAIIVTILFRGIELSFPPRFVLDYASESAGFSINYSQGISQFFGYGAVAATYAANNSSNARAKLLLFISAALFLTLSLLGGARGDSIAAVLIVLVYLLSIKRSRKYALVVLSLIFFTLFFVDFSWLSEVLIFQRLSALGGDNYGLRDVLFSQAFELLYRQPDCIIIGCGIGYFQSFYGYEMGLYPHNFLIEFVITYGIVIFSTGMLLVVLGLRRYYFKVGKLDLFLLFVSYAVLCDMKSGALFDGWLVSLAFLHFAGVAIGKREQINILPH